MSRFLLAKKCILHSNNCDDKFIFTPMTNAPIHRRIVIIESICTVKVSLLLFFVLSSHCCRLEMPKDELPNHNCIKHLRSVVQQQQTKISDLEKTVAEHKHQLGEQVRTRTNVAAIKI